MADALLKITKSGCPDIWIRLPRHKWPNLWSSMEDPVVRLERNLYGHPLAGQNVETAILRKFYFHTVEKKNYSYVYVDDIELAGKKQNINPTWKILMKDNDLGERTSFLDHVYLGCTTR